MPYSPATYEEKPYNRCVDCVHTGQKCDGPNFLAMDIPRLCEWSRLRKDYLHTLDKKWTNAYIADASKLSEKTVARFFAGDIEDLKLTTAASIIKVLIDGTWGKYPCAMAALETETVYVDNPAIVDQCKHLQESLDALTIAHKREVAEIREYEQGRIEYLKEQVRFKEEQMRSKDKLLQERYDFLKRKDKWIAILASALAVALLLIITALVIDSMNPNMGFFWLEELKATFSNTKQYITDNIIKWNFL